MRPISKALSFYLKYFPEMERIYGEGKPPNFERDIPEEEEKKTLEMIRWVGDCALRDATKLLKECSEGMEDIFKVGANIDGISRQSTIERNWQIEFLLWPRKCRRPPRIRKSVGFTLESDAHLYAWLWSRGGADAEDRIVALLPRNSTVIRSRKVQDWAAGSVAIAKIRLLPLLESDPPINIADVIEEARRAFGGLTKDAIETFVGFET